MIIKLRIMADERNEIRKFADLIGTLPEVTETDKVSVHPNYKGEGFRGYLTVTMKEDEGESGGEILTWQKPVRNVRHRR